MEYSENAQISLNLVKNRDYAMTIFQQSITILLIFTDLYQNSTLEIIAEYEKFWHQLHFMPYANFDIDEKYQHHQNPTIFVFF